MSTPQMLFDPHSLEGHYGLDMACYLLHKYRPQTVHLCATDIAVVKAAARRLSWIRQPLSVDSPEIAQALVSDLAIKAAVGSQEKADATLVLLMPMLAQKLTARRLVVLAQNAISYKTLVRPGTVRGNALSIAQQLRRCYRIEERVGLFGARFVMEWTIAQVAGARQSALHFRHGQRAMDNIYITGPCWCLGALVVVAGTRKV